MVQKKLSFISASNCLVSFKKIFLQTVIPKNINIVLDKQLMVQLKSKMSETQTITVLHIFWCAGALRLHGSGCGWPFFHSA